MSIATIKLSDAKDGTVKVVITAKNPREDSNALGMVARIQAFIQVLVDEQSKVEVANSSSVMLPKRELILPDSGLVDY